MANLYFSRSGADKLMNKKQELLDKLRETQGKKAEAADTGGNQWHDNFSFEQLMRDEDMINAQIREVNVFIKDMVVVDDLPSQDTSKLRIGHIADLEVDGEVKSYFIGGFGDSSSSDLKIITISYLAPLVCQFIGKETGFKVLVKISGCDKQVTLKNIRVPAK